jgi:hypothetical protein
MNDLIAVPNCGGANIRGTPDADGNPIAPFFVGRDVTNSFPSIADALQFIANQKALKSKTPGISR